MGKSTIKFLLGQREIKNRKIAFIKTNRNAEPHYHYFVEIVYFLKGRGTHIINNQKHQIKSGDIFLINPFTTHSYETISENNDPVEVYNIVFYADFLSSKIAPERFIDNMHTYLFDTPYKLDNTRTKYIKVEGDIRHTFLSLFQMIEDEFTNQNKGYLICLKNLITLLITNIYRLSNTNSSSSVISSKNKKLINDAVDYLREHATETIALNEIAKKYYFSVSYFNRLLKNHLGMTLNQFLQQERMTKAAKLLQETDMSIVEICDAVGYSDIKFFYALFSKNFGISPAKYRVNIRQENPNN